MGAGEQSHLLPASPKSLHANQTLAFPYHLPLLPLPSTIHYRQGKSSVEQSTKDLALWTAISELCEVKGDMSLQLREKHPEHGPLHKTHNKSDHTTAASHSWEPGSKGSHPPSMLLLGAEHSILKQSWCWMWGFFHLNLPRWQNKGHQPQIAH